MHSNFVVSKQQFFRKESDSETFSIIVSSENRESNLKKLNFALLSTKAAIINFKHFFSSCLESTMNVNYQHSDT